MIRCYLVPDMAPEPQNAITRLILGFGHHDASQWWLNVCLHQLCTELRHIYLVLGHIVYVCDMVHQTCRCLCGICHFLYIVLSILFRVLWHVNFQTKHAGQQLGWWLVATYKLSHWNHEDRMVWRQVCDICCFLHTVACHLFTVLWWVKFQTKHAWCVPGGNILGRLELWEQTD